MSLYSHVDKLKRKERKQERRIDREIITKRNKRETYLGGKMKGVWKDEQRGTQQLLLTGKFQLK
jgi:hypothetical protein